MVLIYASTGYGEYHEGFPCLKASGGDVGGGGEGLICYETGRCLSEGYGSTVCEQPSGELHGTGRVQ